MKDIGHALMIAKTIGDSIGLGNRDVLDQPHKSEGGPIHDPDKTIRRALMTSRSPLHRADGGETDGPAKTTVIGGPVEGDRELDNSGFYNAAAEAAKAIPQAKGTPQQIEQALKLTSKSGATLPAAVFLARQHQRRD